MAKKPTGNMTNVPSSGNKGKSQGPRPVGGTPPMPASNMRTSTGVTTVDSPMPKPPSGQRNYDQTQRGYVFDGEVPAPRKVKKAEPVGGGGGQDVTGI